MINNKKGYRGYCTPNPFGSYSIPAPAQNIIFRDYANKHNLLFKLSVNELIFKNCYLHLFSLLDELSKHEGVFMCSLFVLPNDQELREHIYNKFIDNNSELHLILENLVLKTKEDSEYIEKIFNLQNQSQYSLNEKELKEYYKLEK